MKYRVETQEIITGYIIVEANSEEEAEEIAYERLENIDPVWTESEMTVLTVYENP